MVSSVSLACLLAVRSLVHHRIVAFATILGVAIGMTVVCAVLIVDNNTAQVFVDESGVGPAAASSDIRGTRLGIPALRIAPRIERISFERASSEESRSLVPTQKGGGRQGKAAKLLTDRGAEDYAAMRLAVRLASLLSFLVGAVIVFYTMRFSVAARAREFSLLLCLGESRRGTASTLVVEATILGVTGTLIGLFFAIPAGRLLLRLGISTTGQTPAGTLDVPWGELSAMVAISVAVALLGVISPIRAIFGMEVARILQPRFLSEEPRDMEPRAAGFMWLLPPALAAAYLLVRPVLMSWFSVVYFFLFEAAFVTLLAAATLWWVTPLLRGSIGLFEGILRPIWPLESLLGGRRMRLATRQIGFAVIAVVLVFSMLTALHNITRALKDEIFGWAGVALLPYSFYERTSMPFELETFRQIVRDNGLYFIRMSERITGALPMRIVAAGDVNPVRRARRQPVLVPGTVILSRPLAARFDLAVGDALVIRADGRDHRFGVIEVGDGLGFYAEDGRYVDMRSYAVFSDGNPLFADNLERTLGSYGVARFIDGALPLVRPIRDDALYPYYLATHYGILRGISRTREIDRDFLIFDFILLMTVILAAIGVANTLLIQIHARSREFSVLRTIGMNRWQVTRLLFAEGVIIGLVGALLAAIVGNALGAVSVSFLDHFTLFEYHFRLSWRATGVISGLCLAACLAAAIYPAFVAARTSSAESLHYE